MKRVYRSSEQAVLIAIIGSVVAIIVLIQAYVAFNRGAAWLFITAIAFVFILFSWRGARAAVYAEENGVRVVNPLKTRLVEWSEIEKFSVGSYGPWPHVAYIELKNGSRHHIFGIQAPNSLTRPKNRDAQNLVDQLNHELAARKGQDMTTAPTKAPSAPEIPRDTR